MGDRTGVSNTALALLASIIDLLIYYLILNMANGPETLFYLLFLFLRTIGVVGDDFGQFIELVRNTPVWPLLALVGSQVGMVLSAAVTFAITWWTVGITSRMLAWRRAGKEQKREICTKKRKRRLWWKGLKGEGGESLVILPKLVKANEKPRFKPTIATGKVNKVGKPTDWRVLTRTEWWQIPKTQVVTLMKGKLSELVLEAKKLVPEGSYAELAKTLGVAPTLLRRIVREGRDSMSVGRLLKLLDLLGAPYEILTPHIRSVGGKSAQAITNPKFPIDLYNPEGARLLAAALKDGDITNGDHHFDYTNYDNENIRIVTEAVQQVFGDIEPTILYDQDGRQRGIKFNSAVIGEVLLRAGAVEGRKAEKDYHLPDMIKHGDYPVRNAYFEQAIRDDGNRDYENYRIKITCAQELKSKVKKEHLRVIENSNLEEKRFPSQAIKLVMRFTGGTEKRLPRELRPAYEDLVSKMSNEWIPTILKEEAEIMQETYNVEVVIRPKEIYVGEKRGLRGAWNIMVERKENFEKMVRQLDSVWKKGGDKG
ncbi:MAG: hypothetical protein JTT11_10570 [Candidatus Brockarchaeota archaeon]|nr:hypothetical protein [Candidatus Brockarchaeota archaeon]